MELRERVKAPEAISPRAEAVYESLVPRIQGAVATITWASEDVTHLWTPSQVWMKMSPVRYTTSKLSYKNDLPESLTSMFMQVG
ncbi:MAG: hypothetical protein ACLQOO_11535 [Terriglobia bacterium]